MKKKANKIKVMGVAEPLSVTFDHDCMVVKRKDVKCRNNKNRNNKNCITGYNAPTCKRYKCSEYQDKNYKISKIKARDVKKGDYFLVPFDSTIRDSLIKDKDQARFAGFLASDGSVSDKYKNVRFCMNKDEVEAVFPSIKKVFSDFGLDRKLEKCKSLQLLSVRSSSKKVFEFAHSLVQGKGKDKKFTQEVMLLDPKLQLYVLGAYIQADGCYNKINKAIEITTYSMHLANQLITMFYRCGILARVNKQPISKSKGTFSTNNTHRYIINVPSSETHLLKEYVPYKIISDDFKKFRGKNRFFWGNYVLSPVSSNDSFDYEGPVYDIRVPRSFTVTANGVSVYQCRFYYTNEPKVAAGVDFYCFEPNSQVLMANGTQKSISSIVEGDYVRSHDGSSNVVEKVHKRIANEDLLRIKISGVSMGTMKVTKGHELLTEREGKVKFIPALSLSEGDYLLTPCNYESSDVHTVNNDFAWLVGIYAAEGCGIPYTHTSKKSKYSQYFNGVVFVISIDEKDTLAQEIKKKVKNIGKITDVLFIGTGNHKFLPFRNKIINDLRATGIKIKVFGRGWDKHPDTRGFISGHELLREINRAKMLLDLNSETTSLSHRIFEGSACGTPVITNYRGDMRRLFRICEEIIPYKQFSELERTIKYYLDNPQ
ncbi:hypothetical protein LCGC14_2052410, partial [marine sediment metagenome]